MIGCRHPNAAGLRPLGTVAGVVLTRILAPAYPGGFPAANSGTVAGACVL